jgi:hypothetical protein
MGAGSQEGHGQQMGQVNGIGNGNGNGQVQEKEKEKEKEKEGGAFF